MKNFDYELKLGDRSTFIGGPDEIETISIERNKELLMDYYEVVVILKNGEVHKSEPGTKEECKEIVINISTDGYKYENSL